MKKFILPLGVLLISPLIQAKAPEVKFGGFIDTYYAYDFNRPKNHERDYTTQPVRHSEFNVNLAYLEAMVTSDKTRGRLALQFGNSVIKNSSGEPTLGATSGAQDSKYIQEGFVGRKIGEKTWIDVGIFLASIGSESWISKDNWTYSRALFSDYVPYYWAGARLEHQIDQKQSFQLLVLNGWGIMSENNEAKSIATQYKRLMSEFTFTYNGFFGDEEVTSVNPRFRAYHNFILQWNASDLWQFLYAFDVAHQSQKENNGTDGWFATALTVRRVLNSLEALALRLERYADPHEANVATGTDHGFQVTSLSMNYDYKLEENALWRTEIRGYTSRDRIFPAQGNRKNRYDGYVVTSLSLWF